VLWAVSVNVTEVAFKSGPAKLLERRFQWRDADPRMGLGPHSGKLDPTVTIGNGVRSENSKVLILPTVSGIEWRLRVKPRDTDPLAKTLYRVEAKIEEYAIASFLPRRPKLVRTEAFGVRAPELRGIGRRARAPPD